MTKSFDIKLILLWNARMLLAFVLSGLGTWVMMYILRLDLTHDPILIGLMFGLFFGIIIGRWWAGLVLALLLVLIYWDDPILHFLSGRPYFTGSSNDIAGFDEETEQVFGILIAASVTSLISGYLLSLAMRLNLINKGHLKESETYPHNPVCLRPQQGRETLQKVLHGEPLCIQHNLGLESLRLHKAGGEFVITPALMMGMDDTIIIDRIAFGGVKELEELYLQQLPFHETDKLFGFPVS